MRTLTLQEWQSEGTKLFGPDMMDWMFVCPSCSHICKASQWKDVGAPEGAVAFSCVGRWMATSNEAFAKGPGPCNYAGGGLIGINPVRVIVDDKKHFDVFEFAAKTVDENDTKRPK